MHRTAIRPPASYARPRPRAAAGDFDLFGPPPDERTAAAMDDAAEAQRLMDDLVALIDAGLVAPLELDGKTRYAPADPTRAGE